MQAILNEIDGKDHTGAVKRPVPSVFGMNFQAVSVGQKLVEKSVGQTGGYLDAIGTPSAELQSEIGFVDTAIGRFVSELQHRGLYEKTLIVISAKHGQSPIDPRSVLRIPADAPTDQPPSAIISPAGVGPGFPAVQALEDDVSLLWLADNSLGATKTAINALEINAAKIGADGGEFFYGPQLALMFNDPSVDPRTP